MADFIHIQKRLNSDEKYRAEFLKDPEKVLKDSGVTIDKKNAKALKLMTKKLLETPAWNGGGGIGISIHF
jgi:hypothetical protein